MIKLRNLIGTALIQCNRIPYRGGKCRDRHTDSVKTHEECLTSKLRDTCGSQKPSGSTATTLGMLLSGPTVSSTGDQFPLLKLPGLDQVSSKAPAKTALQTTPGAH